MVHITCAEWDTNPNTHTCRPPLIHTHTWELQSHRHVIAEAELGRGEGGALRNSLGITKTNIVPHSHTIQQVSRVIREQRTN